MRTPSFRRHRLLATLLLSVLTGMTPSIAFSEPVAPVLELRPHCEGGNPEAVFGGTVPDNPFMTAPATSSCAAYEVLDPQTRQTTRMRSGNTLDMDLVIHNPGGISVSRVRSLLAYDPSLLEGQDITIHPSFTMPSPDGQQFSTTDGTITIDAATESVLASATIVVARIRMRVTSASESQTIIAFVQSETGQESPTAIFTTEAGQERSIPTAPPGSLLVQMGISGIVTPQPSGSAPVMPASAPATFPSSNNAALRVVPAAQSTPPPSAPLPAMEATATEEPAAAATNPAPHPPDGGSSTFPLLQVQNVRITTDGSTVYLAWDSLKSAELAGYNVYYGAVTGAYIHRRSLDRTATTLTLRNLPQDVRTYAAVRGVNAGNQETEFSQEVAVIVGKPQTSTSPLLASSLPKGPQGISPKTGGSIAGDTGSSPVLLLLILVSAAIGTGLALRRQYSATPYRIA